MNVERDMYRQAKPIARLVWAMDLRYSAPGTVLGEGRRVQVCQRCGMPGLYWRAVHCKDGLHRRMAHGLEFYETAGDTRCVYINRCTEPDPVPPTPANDTAADTLNIESLL